MITVELHNHRAFREYVDQFGNRIGALPYTVTVGPEGAKPRLIRHQRIISRRFLRL